MTSNQFNGSGSAAGVVFYNEGFIVLTGTWSLDTVAIQNHMKGAGNITPKWYLFGELAVKQPQFRI